MWIYSSFVYIYSNTSVTIEIKHVKNQNPKRQVFGKKTYKAMDWTAGRGRGGRTPSDGLYGEAPPESVPFFILQVYVRVGISLVEVEGREICHFGL